MPSFRPVIFAALASALFAPTGAAAQTNSADLKAIREVYGRLSAAVKGRDIKAIAALGTPDFSQKERNGRVLKGKEALDAMEQSFRGMKKIDSVKMLPRAIAVNKNRATATVDYALKAVVVDRGKPQNLDVDLTTKDTLVKTPQGWKIKSIVALSGGRVVDGQKVELTPRRVSTSQTIGRPGGRR